MKAPIAGTTGALLEPGMGHTSASLKVNGDSDMRLDLRPSSRLRRPVGASEDGSSNVRNLIPWSDMEKKLAEKLASKVSSDSKAPAAPKVTADGHSEARPKEARPKDEDKTLFDVPPKFVPPWRAGKVEPAPDSGVRASTKDSIRNLSYSVYTVAELEALAQSRPARMTMVSAPLLSPCWGQVGELGKRFLASCWAYVRSPKPRPALRDVCEAPFRAFVAEFSIALRTLPWKRIGLGAGLALGTLLVLLFVVLTAAELTDDLKPARRGRTTNSDVSAAAALSKAESANSLVATPAATTGGDSIELDEAPPAPPRKPAAKPHGKKKKPVELFNP